MKPPTSFFVPSAWIPNGLTMNTTARRRSSNVSKWISTLSSALTRSRSASVARTAPCGSNARTPTCIAVAEYQSSTSVESGAGRPSTGWYSENPVSRAARRHTASSRRPSTAIVVSTRTAATSSRPLRPS